MAVLLSMAVSEAKADNRQVIYEETFTNGMGSFTVVDEGFPANDHPETWHWDQEGCATIQQGKLKSKKDIGYSYLLSPVIDLSNWHNATLSFEQNTMADEKIWWLELKDENSDWKKIDGTECFVESDQFIKSRYYYLSRYNGHHIQIRFAVMMHMGTYLTSINKIRNFKIEGEEGSASDQPIHVDNIKEFLELPEYTFAEITLNSAVVTCTYQDLNFVKDASAAMSCIGLVRDESGNTGAIKGFPGWKLDGTITGVRTSQFGKNELSDGFVYVTITWPDNIEDYTMIPPIEIDYSDFDDYEGTPVTIETKDPTLLVYHYSDGYRSARYTYQYNSHFRATGVPYLAPDGDKRFLVDEFSSFIINLMDGDSYEYNKYKGKYRSPQIYRTFKENQWNTACLPFTINAANASNYIGECSYATLSKIEDGTIYFTSIDISNGETISAGTPFLIKPSSEINKINAYYNIIEDLGGQISVNGGDYNFVGTLEPTQPADGTYYLSANNTIKPLASGGTINAFRAYFEPASPNAAKARAISIDGMTTAIEDIAGGEELLGLPQKIYTVGGQYVGDDLNALSKGVYLVNGKKIIK